MIADTAEQRRRERAALRQLVCLACRCPSHAALCRDCQVEQARIEDTRRGAQWAQLAGRYTYAIEGDA